jgi:prevent-host-death family protein
MRTVGSRELKNRLGRYLGLVGKGETIIVTDRGKPVARLVPPPPETDKAPSVDDVLKRLEAEGHLSWAHVRSNASSRSDSGASRCRK